MFFYDAEILSLEVYTLILFWLLMIESFLSYSVLESDELVENMY